MKHLAPTIAALFLAFTAVATPATAQSDPAATGCAGMFPDVAWTSVHAAHPVTIRMSEISEGLGARYADEIRGSVGLIQPEFGSLDGVEVCLFSNRLPLDAQALGWPVGQALRAASFGEERVLVLSAWNIGLVKPAAAIGLAHQAEWGLTDGSYPGPFGGAVAGWYQARLEGTLDGAHRTMVFANLIRSIPESIPWTAGTIEGLMLWNPEFQGSGAIGDFVEYVRSEEGLDAVLQPDGEQLAALQATWQRELINEARGSDRPTTGWIGGLIIGVTSVLLAIGMAWHHGRSKRRQRPSGPPRTIPVQPREPVAAAPATNDRPSESV